MSADIQDVQDEAINGLREDSVLLLEKAFNEMGIKGIGEMTPHRVSKIKKDAMSELLLDSLQLLEEFTTVITTDFKTATRTVKVKMIESQQTIIKLQSELLVCKNEQLESLQTTVKSSVGESVKAEFQSYSSVLQKNSAQPEKTVTTEELKKVVQTVVQEEDRSRNLMIFGLPEKDDEEINDTVSQVFQAIGEKPRVEAGRVGKKKSDKTVRPVRVTVASTTIVNQILAKAKNLKRLENYRTVFVSPDRSPEQRARQRALVKDLKRLATEEPDKVHFIRDGKISSADKTGKRAP